MFGYIFSDSTYDLFLNNLVKGFSSSTLRNFNETIVFPLRRKYLSRKLAPYLKDNCKVLDLGSSDGRLAHCIKQELEKEQRKVSFTGCDIHVQTQTYIPIIEYDGKRLPFEDNSFDCILIVDVLHHTNKPLEVLKEAKRVTRKNILIKDHYWTTQKDFIRLKHADYIGNHPYGIPLPNNFLNKEGWQNLVQKCQLFVEEKKTYKVTFDPCKHIIYRLTL